MLPESAQPISVRPPSLAGLRSLAISQWQILVLGSFVVLAAAVRMVDITAVPKGFFTDEASFGLNADLIWHTGRDEHGKFLPVLFRSFGEYKLPVFIYAEVPFVAIFGRTEEAVRLTSAVLGSLTVVTVYLLAKELFRRELPALAAAAFLATMPWHVHYSRTGLGDIVALPLFFSFGFYLFFRAMRDGRFLVPAAVVLALSFYTYRGGWLVLPPMLLLMTAAYYRELIAYRTLTAIAAGVFVVLLLPLAFHLLFSDTDRASQAWIFNLDDDRSTLGIFVDFYRSYFTQDFLFDKGDNNALLRHYLPGQGQLLLVQMPLIAIGIFVMLLRFNRRYLFVLALVLLYPLTASVSDTSPISSRAILGSVAFALLSGFGLWALANEVALRLTPYRRQVGVTAVVAVTAAFATFGFVSYTDRYHDDYPLLSDGFWGWQDGPQEIVRYFVAVEDEYDEMFMDGGFNAPYIFFRFYAGDEACRNCYIGSYDFYHADRRQLFALKPETIADSGLDFRVLGNVYYEDGTVAFRYVEFTGRALQPSNAPR